MARCATRPSFVALLIIAGALAGCDGPAQASPTDIAPERLVLSPADSAGFVLALEDVRTRILPVLGSQAATAPLRRAVDALGQALSLRDPAAREGSLAALGRALEELSGAELEPELEVVRLLMGHAASLGVVGRPAVR